MTHPRFDVVIAGSGPAGLAAAIALQERGLSVAVLNPLAVNPTPRAEMLPPAAELIIARLGIADVLEQAVALQPALGLWSTARPEILGHASAPHRPAISIDRYALITLLDRRVEEMGGHFHPYRLCGIAGRPSAWRVATSDGQELRTRFAIDATGRPAYLARRMGAQLCLGAPIVARTHFLSARPRPQLVIEATANGWWYSLPMRQGGTAGFVSEVGTPPEMPRLLPMHGDFPPRAETWDARNGRLSPCAGPGWLATGDAAAAFDPVASQGLFNALSGGFFAGNAAADALLGKPDALSVYADLVARTAVRTHQATPHHYATARGQSGFWRRRRAHAFSAKSERPTPSSFTEQASIIQANFI